MIRIRGRCLPSLGRQATLVLCALAVLATLITPSSAAASDSKESSVATALDRQQGTTPSSSLCTQKSGASPGTTPTIPEAPAVKKAGKAGAPSSVWLDPAYSYVYHYRSVTDQLTLDTGTSVESGGEFEPQDSTTTPSIDNSAAATPASVNRSHSLVDAEVVLTVVSEQKAGQWIDVQIAGACITTWTENLATSAPLASLASDQQPSVRPDRVEDVGSEYAGNFQFFRRSDGGIVDIAHASGTEAGIQAFREGIINSLSVDLAAALAGQTKTETDRTTTQSSKYKSTTEPTGKVTITRTADIPILGLTRSATISVEPTGEITAISSHDELAIETTSDPDADPFTVDDSPGRRRPVNWTESDDYPDAGAGGISSPVDGHVLSVNDLVLVRSQAIAPGVVASAQSDLAGAQIRNTLTPVVAQTQLVQIERDLAGARWGQAMDLVVKLSDGETPGDVAARDQALPEVLSLMHQALAAEPALAAEAADTVLTMSTSNWGGQTIVASLASAETSATQQALARILREGVVLDEQIQVTAFANASVLVQPSDAVVNALLTRAQTPSPHSGQAAMVLGATASRSSNATLKAEVEGFLVKGLATPEAGATYSAALANLGTPGAVAASNKWLSDERAAESATFLAAPVSVPPAGKVPVKSGKGPVRGARTTGADEVQTPGAGFGYGLALPIERLGTFSGQVIDPATSAICTEYDLACAQQWQVDCVLASSQSLSFTPPSEWAHCGSYWIVWEPSGGTGTTGGGTSGSNYVAAEPGDLFWETVIGPEQVQGHFWIGLRPSTAGRLASLSAEAGLELKNRNNVKPIVFAQAAFRVNQIDQNTADNVALGDMTIGQVSRALVLKAEFGGTPIFPEKSFDFPCGVGASGGIDHEHTEDWSHNEEIPFGNPFYIPPGENAPVLDDPENNAETNDGKLFPEFTWGGPSFATSVPVMGVATIRFEASIGARLAAEWGWSLDICDFDPEGTLLTAAAEVSVSGSVNVQVSAGITFLLVEAGIGVTATVYSVDAPLIVSVQLVNDNGTLRLNPCYGFYLNTSIWAVKVFAFATVFIKVPFLGRIVLWKESITLFDFNMGDELGIPGRVKIFGSDCKPVRPIPPVIKDAKAGSKVSAGLFTNPTLSQGGVRLPLGSAIGTWTEANPLFDTVNLFCANFGLAPAPSAPNVAQDFESATDAPSYFEAATVSYSNSQTGYAYGKVDSGSWTSDAVQATDYRVTEVRCGEPVENTEVSVTTTIAGVSADDQTAAPQLNHEEVTTVDLALANTGSAPVTVAGLTSDQAVVDSCSGLVVPAGGTATCSFDYTVGGVQYSTLSTPVTHNLAVTFTDSAVEPVQGGWYHLVDPATYTPDLTVALGIVDDDDRNWAGGVAPGPILNQTGETVIVNLTVQSQEPLDSLSVGAPFAFATCTPTNSAKHWTCLGEGNLTPPAGGQGTFTINAGSGTKQFAAQLDWWARSPAEPELLVSSVVDAAWANVYPGPVIGPEDVEIRFTVSNLTETSLESLSLDFDWANQTVTTTCDPIVGPGDIDCVAYAVTVPHDLVDNQVSQGTVSTTYGGGQTSEAFFDFYWRTDTSDLISWPTDGETIDIGEPDAGWATRSPQTGTGTGTFEARGRFDGTSFSLTATNAEIVGDVDLNLDDLTWRATILPTASGVTSLTATSAPPDGGSSSATEQSIDVTIIAPLPSDTIMYETVTSLEDEGIAVISMTKSSGAATMVLTGERVSDIFDGSILTADHDYAGAATDGVLREVVGDPTIVGDIATVDTIPAGVDDAFRQVDLYDTLDEVGETVTDYVSPVDVTIDGEWGAEFTEATFDVQPYWDLKIGPWYDPAINYFEIGIAAEAELGGRIWAEGSIDVDGDNLPTIFSKDRPFMIGLVPMTFGIDIEPVVGAQINGRLDVSAGFRVEAGAMIRYDRDATPQWITPVTPHDSSTPLEDRGSYATATEWFNVAANGVGEARGGVEVQFELLVADTIGPFISLIPVLETVTSAELNVDIGASQETSAQQLMRGELAQLDAWAELAAGAARETTLKVETEWGIEVELPVIDLDIGELEQEGPEIISELIGASHLAWEATRFGVTLYANGTVTNLRDAAPIIARCFAATWLASFDPASGVDTVFLDGEHLCNALPVYMPGAELGAAGVLRDVAISQHPSWAVQARVGRKDDNNPTNWYKGVGWNPNFAVPAGDQVIPGTTAAQYSNGCSVKPTALLPYPNIWSCDEFPNASMMQGSDRTGAGLGELPVLAYMPHHGENEEEGHRLGEFYDACRVAKATRAPKSAQDMRDPSVTPDTMLLVIPIVAEGLDTSWVGPRCT